MIHGLDADLIMLALATHEPHFTVLRELVLDRRAKEKQDAANAAALARGERVGPPRLMMLRVWVLREYLEKEFSPADFSKVPGGYDLERVIDDFVFMCFFVGNDFLPHIPALEIRDGAIDMLIFAYKALLPKLGGYLSDSGRVHLARTELLLRELASREDEIFERQRRREESMARAKAARDVAGGGDAPSGAFGSLYPPRDATQRRIHDAIKAYAATAGDGEPPPLEFAQLSGFHKASAHLYCTLHGLVSSADKERNTLSVRRGKAGGKGGGGKASGGRGGGGAAEEEEHGDFETRLALRLQKKEAQMSTQVDEVRVGERGWKERYYHHKFGIRAHDGEAEREIIGHYVHGLCWVLMYYYQGVQDWGWFYPFHFAPAASDLVKLNDFAGKCHTRVCQLSRPHSSRPHSSRPHSSRPLFPCITAVFFSNFTSRRPVRAGRALLAL